MPDMQCTLWPDTWFGISLTQCCINHDLGGSEFELMMCVFNESPWLFVVGVLMFIGTTIAKPYYDYRKKHDKEKSHENVSKTSRSS